MIKSVIFTAKLDDVNCMDGQELLKLLERVGAKIAEVSPNVAIDPQVQIEEIKPVVQDTSFGDAMIDGFMKVERTTGEVKYFHNINGKSYEITEESYNKQHSIGSNN